MAKKKNHSGRSFDESGKVTCSCGESFDSDSEWRDHYEANTTEKERMKIEGRIEEESNG